ncbi:MAG: PIN domain-containing protein [Methanothrix sp.]|nr:PIN domain-containing protein [Methanothrix sp.]
MKNMRRIFIDANIFTYLLTGHPIHGRACQQLLERVENGDLEGYISPLVIDEVSYVLMVQTARKTRRTEDARSIKQEMLAAWKECLAPVGEFHDYLDTIISAGHLKVLSLDYSISRIALECAKEHRLLPRDALHVACCKAYGIKEMATNDGDFKRVSFLTLWHP